MRRALFVLAVLCLSVLSLSSAGCHHARGTWVAEPLQTNVVRIMPAGIKNRGGILYVQTTFINVSQKPVVVDRDGARAVLYNGQIIGRGQGTFTRHQPYTIMPGASQPVYVDFRAEGFEWTNIGQIAVDFSNAVLVDGQPVQLPPLVLTSRGDED